MYLLLAAEQEGGRPEVLFCPLPDLDESDLRRVMSAALDEGVPVVLAAKVVLQADTEHGFWNPSDYPSPSLKDLVRRASRDFVARRLSTLGGGATT